MRFKDFIKESIIDIPRQRYAPGVFDNADTNNPKLKKSVRDIILNQIDKFSEKYPVKKYSLIGSILTKKYRDDADLDMNILFDVPKEKQEEVRKELASSLRSINGKLVPGTKHPINYFVITDPELKKKNDAMADGVFDIDENEFVRRPTEDTFDSEKYEADFQAKVKEIDVVKGELARDIIDYEELKDLTADDVLNLQARVNSKLDEIEDSIEVLVDIGDDVVKQRQSAFNDDMSPEEIRQFGKKHKLPKNIIYKYLEKYHYLKFYKKCKDILEDGKVTDKEISSLKTEAITLDKVKIKATYWFKNLVTKIKMMATTQKRYEYAAKVLQDVIDRKKKEQAQQGVSLRHDIGWYASVVADTFKDIDGKKLQTMVHEQLELLDEAAPKTIAFAFGRFNPPTIGHLKLMDKVKSASSDYKIYLSRSEDPKKNPLGAREKLDLMKRMFPQHARNIAINPSNNVLDILTKLYDTHHRVIMVAGSDRVREFDTLLNRYNNVKSRHGYYYFEDIKVVSAGDRDPDAEGAAGMSASKMRAAAAKGDLEAFKSGLPGSSKGNGERIMTQVRKGMKLAASYKMETYKPITSVEGFEQEQVRDLYVRDMIFNINDKVDYIKEDIKGTVKRRGTNYIVIEDNNNNLHKAWIWDCLPIAADREIEVREYNTNIDYGFEAVSEMTENKISQSEINNLERFADRILNKYGVDIEFTRHFVDRLNDARNNPSIKVAELQKFFKKIQKNKARNIIKQNDQTDAVLKDMETNLNLPVKIIKRGNEFEVINKTIMRKTNFHVGSSKTIRYEDKTQQDKDVEKKDGTQPKKYYSGLSKDVKDKRADHFKNNDSNKPAPGDADAKTEPSKHTKKFRQMYGETKKNLQDACWVGYKQVGMKKKGNRQVPNCVPESMSLEDATKVEGYVSESYEIGADYANHTKEMTPGQTPDAKAVDAKDKGPHKYSKFRLDNETNEVKEKDIKEWALSDAVLDKYKERYKELWREKLDEVVKRMMDKI